MNENDYIILPTYNERSNISDLILRIFELHPDINILVVDDNSPDGTRDAVKKLQKKYRNLLLMQRKKKEGLGRAYIDAFKTVLAKKDVRSIIMMDADFSHNPKYLETMFKKMDDYDLVIGSRYVKQGKIESWELWRRLLSWGGNTYCLLILRYPIFDWTTGFNCINPDYLRKIDLDKLDFSGYAFIIGIKYHLVRIGAKAAEIPITFEARRGGESKLSNHIIREGIPTPWRLIF